MRDENELKRQLAEIDKAASQAIQLDRVEQNGIFAVSSSASNRKLNDSYEINNRKSKDESASTSSTAQKSDK